jgi:hypothetical protein
MRLAEEENNTRGVPAALPARPSCMDFGMGRAGQGVDVRQPTDDVGPRLSSRHVESFTSDTVARGLGGELRPHAATSWNLSGGE